MYDEQMEEIMKKIEESAGEVPVPESLAPEQIKEKLQQMPKKKHFSRRRWAELAAAIALVAAVGGTGVYRYSQEIADPIPIAQEENTEASDTATEEMHSKKESVGSYRLAASYEDVYDAVAYVEESDWIDSVRDIWYSVEDNFAGKNYDMEDSAVEESASTAEASSDFSTTNTQVAGVDESDFIKNDGSYLYVQSEDCVSVVDIQNEEMKTVATIRPELDASAQIADMYVDGDRLYLVVQKRDSNLVSYADDEDVTSDVAYVDTASSTELLTYDITGRTGGTLEGTVTVDGSYDTSRKVGDVIYLFTSQYVGDRTESETDGIIPQVNGKDIASDCIYVQDNSTREYIAVSVDTAHPDETVDQLVLMNAYVEIYMGTDSIYLYADSYENDSSYTDITKFSYKDGYMDAVAATSVIGTIQDTFAISEEDGILRVLTTDWTKSASENQLYLLDENLKLKGSLKNIATGEEIYAARYIGDTAYFITYHNTDPLFAVDISDPTDPKLLGQVEMTGFSDYLHPYGDNLLLGIGYETDPDTSETLGVKLTMFDISDPVDLKILDTVVLDGGYCAAASNYKCALADVNKNLIGFEVTDYGSTVSCKYMVYSWDGDHFVKKMSEELDGWYDEEIRGLYAGSRFYVVDEGEGGYRIRSYDMEEKFAQIDELKL